MEMPQIGLGTYLLKGRSGIEVIKSALEMGYRHIDTAQMYGNEKEVGEGVRESNVKREDIFITTKICTPNTSYQKTYDAVLISLKNLGVDYIDLVLIHEPYSAYLEMYRALEDLVKEKKVRYIGVSNFNKNEITNLLNHCKIPPYVNQIEMHIFYQQESYLKFLQERNIKVVAWSPLCADASLIINNNAIKKIAKKHKKNEIQVALRFLLQNGVYIIPKSKDKNRLKENIDLFDFSLDNEDTQEIKSLDLNKSKFGWYY